LICGAKKTWVFLEVILAQAAKNLTDILTRQFRFKDANM